MIKVSVILPMYNSEKYIEDAIKSFINQDLEEKELIIIDDGSSDNSVNIVNRYIEIYKNIRLIRQKKSGTSVARNNGVGLANGEYITFLDSDDLLEKNTFNLIYKKIKKNKADIFIGNILCFNDMREWHLPYMKDVFKDNKDLVDFKECKEILNTPSVCNKWFKKDIISNNFISFNPNLHVAEDLLFTQECYLKSAKILKLDLDIYKYRVGNNDSLIRKADIEFFNQLLEVQKEIVVLYKKNNESYRKIIERQIIFFIDSIFLKSKQLSDDDIVKLCDIGRKLLNIENNIYNLDRDKFRTFERYFLAILFIKGKDEEIKKLIQIINYEDIKREVLIEKECFNYLKKYFDNYDDYLVQKPIVLSKVEKIKRYNNIVEIKGYAFLKGIEINSYEKVEKSIILEGKNNYFNIKLENELRTDLKYLYKSDNINYDFGGYKSFKIDINQLANYDDEYNVFIEIKVKNIKVRAPLKCRLAENKNILKVIYKKESRNRKEIFFRFINSEDLVIRIRTLNIENYMKSKIRKKLRDIKYAQLLIKKKKYRSVITLYIHKIVGIFIRRKKIWLFGERRDMAQDNSYHLFKYIKENHSNINAKYLIDKNSKDFKFIKRFKSMIKFGSIRHTLYLLNCDKSINSYVERANMYTKEYLDIIKYYPEYAEYRKKIFLQHGVIGVSRVNHVLHKNKVDYDLFIVSSQSEKEHIVKEYGFSKDEVVVTGLARWDNLKDNFSEGKILLMPTWRSWIKSEEQLLESNYFRTYIELLKSKKLKEYLILNNKKITFYPHYQTRKLIKNLNIDFGDNIEMIDNEKKTVQELINEHGILITDYSTVSFDFIYKKKKVIFYQFDYDEFYSKHYNSGIIDHSKELFGIRVTSKNEVIDALNGIILENKGYENKYIVKIESHCKKIYEEILNIN